MKRYLFSIPAIPVALTVGGLFLVSLTGVLLQWPELLLVIILVVLQIFLPYAGKLSSLIVPVEKLTPGARSGRQKWIQWLPLVVAVFPVFFLVHFNLVLLLTIFAWLVISPYVWSLLIRIIRKEKISQSNLEQLRHEAPQVVVYVSGLYNVAYQINQWLPVLERLTVKPLIVVRESQIVQGMDATEIPIFFAHTMFDVETLYNTMGGSLRVVLYPGNSRKCVESFRHSQLQHFFINHGESDKSVNQSKLLMAYDKLLVAGPLA